MIQYKLVFLEELSQLEMFVIEEREDVDGFPQNFSGRVSTSEGTGPLLRIERMSPVNPTT